MRLIARLFRAAGALTGLLGLLGGIPAALITFVGRPLPDHLPTPAELEAFTTTPLSDETISDALACVVWGAWAIIAATTITEILARISGRRPPDLPGFGWAQALAGALVGALSLTGGTTMALTTLAQPATAATQPHTGQNHRAAHAPLNPPHDVPQTTTNTTGTRPGGQVATRQVRVHRGDTLWSIAERTLGAGRTWPRIAHLNLGTLQPDGARFTRPNLIHPGWVLKIPIRRTDTDHHHRAHSRTPRPSPHPTSPADPAPRPSPPETVSPPVQHNPDEHTSTDEVRLPSGAIVGVTLAAAIGTALLLARRHRSRRRGIATIPGGTPPEPTPTPTQRRLRRAHLATRHTPDEAPDLAAASAHPPGRHAKSTRHAPDPRPTPDVHPSSPSEAAPRESTPPPVSVLPAALHPRTGEVGLDLTSVPGLGLDGPGAADAARHLIIHLLAPRTGADHDTDAARLNTNTDTAEVLIAGDDATGLLPEPPAPGAVPGLVRTSGLAEALARAEADLVHRTRLLDDADVTDYHAYRTTHPDEPLPLMLIVTTPPIGASRRRLATVLAVGQNLGIAGLLLGDWPHGGTGTLDHTGHCTTVNTPVLAGIRDTRLGTLTRPDAAELLTLIATAHGHPDPALPGEQEPAVANSGPRISPSDTTQPHPAPPMPAPAPTRRTTLDTPSPPAPPAEEEPEQPAESAPGSTAMLHVFGPVRVTTNDAEVGMGPRRKSRELAAWLACHPDGGSFETIAADLWPDADRNHARERVHDAVTSLRRALRNGIGPARHIPHTAGRYRIDPDTLRIDQWEFTRALQHAARAGDDTVARTRLLQQAADLYTGELAADLDAEWIEPIRETHRRDAADALAHLAELRDDPETALADLEHAASIDPYNEELTRRIMRTQTDLGRHDAVRRTYQLLETRLSDLDTDPDEPTHKLLTELLHTEQHG